MPKLKFLLSENIFSIISHILSSILNFINFLSEKLCSINNILILTCSYD